MTYRLQPLVWDSHKSDVIIGVSNHQPQLGLLNCAFRRRSKGTSKLRVTGLCAGKSPVNGEFLAQMASYAEKLSIWWRHHALTQSTWDQNQYDDFMSWKRLPHCWQFARVSKFKTKDVLLSALFMISPWYWYWRLEIIIHRSVITTSLTNSQIHLCTIDTVMSHERYGASNHHQLECSFNNLSGITSKNISKLHILSPWESNPLLTGRFPSRIANDAENIPMSWSHHVLET